MQQIPESIKSQLMRLKSLLEEQGSAADIRKSRDDIVKEEGHGEHAIVHNILARAAKELGEKELAIAHMQKSLELDPDNITAILLVSSYYIQLGDQGSAKKTLGLAEGLEIQTSEQATGLSRLLVATGQTEKSIEFLDSVLRDNPNNPDLRLTRASLLLDASRLEESSEDLRASLDQGLNSGCLKPLIKTLSYQLYKGDRFLALAACDAALTICLSQGRPRDNFIFLKSLALTSVGNISESLKTLNNASNHLRPISNYAWCSLQAENGSLGPAESSLNACINGIRNSAIYHDHENIRKAIDQVTAATSSDSQPTTKEKIVAALSRINEETNCLLLLLEI